jgi:NADH-quinone oxidoreductase subunit L
MPDLESIAPLAWLIPTVTALSFVAAIAIVVAGASGRWAARLVVAGMLVSTVIAMVVFGAAVAWGGEELSAHPIFTEIPWAPMGGGWLSMGLMIDPLSVIGIAFVSLICAAIFVFSLSYMEGEFTAYRDPVTGEVDAAVGNARYGRFFAFVALFATGMLGFVLSSNLLQALVFWEVMGLCSFLLIGFWYHKPSASKAAVKAFLTTRVGDMFFFVGILALFAVFGTVDYATMLSREGVATLVGLGSVPGTDVPWAAVLALLVFGGAVGKSAQFPLHVWLPDAMEGPTPVSALIHAATMVSAGVFLVARMYPLFSAASFAHPGEISGPMFVVGAIGGFTALMAASIALAQFDIKRVLAYSTISQLGYMFLALGIGAYVAAVFHLVTHAFFKALLFLGSGSVIHGVEHGMHHADAHESHGDRVAPAPASPGADPHDAQDMRNMGYLRVRMPFTFLTFLAGSLALTGVIPFAGFWSKDEIIAEAFHKGITLGALYPAVLWLIATFVAFLTAFYVARQVFMVFAGPPQGEGALHAGESDWRMVGPLVFLALFAVFAGLVGMPEGFPVLGSLLKNPLHHYVGALPVSGAHFETIEFSFAPMLISIGLVILGWVGGWLLYGRQPERARHRDPLQRLGPIWTLLHRKYYVDEIYGATVVRLSIWFSDVCALLDRTIVDGLVNLVGRAGEASTRAAGWIDRVIVDGAVNLAGAVPVELGRGLRSLQTGRVQQYLLVVFVSLLALVVAFVM